MEVREAGRDAFVVDDVYRLLQRNNRQPVEQSEAVMEMAEDGEGGRERVGKGGGLQGKQDYTVKKSQRQRTAQVEALHWRDTRNLKISADGSILPGERLARSALTFFIAAAVVGVVALVFFLSWYLVYGEWIRGTPLLLLSIIVEALAVVMVMNLNRAGVHGGKIGGKRKGLSSTLKEKEKKREGKGKVCLAPYCVWIRHA